MKKLIILMLCIIMLAAATGCTNQQQPQKRNRISRGDRSVRQYNRPGKLTEGNSTFALNLYQLLKTRVICFIPHTVYPSTGAMTWGELVEKPKSRWQALQFLLSQEKLHPAFNAIDIELAKRGQGAQGKDDEGFRLKVVNAIWGQQGFKFNEEYLDLLATNYGAGMRLVDYIKATEQARQTINQWVSDQTEDRIQDLLPQGSLTDMTRLVLTNAIYFNAAWACQYNTENTQDGQFKLLEGGNVIVPMMKQMNQRYDYTEGPNFRQ